uniref:Uncharacterized protein n=1 Tax=Arion vulgaris TaxID=1028688 RepID=A0A0B6YBE2_9EUPU
MYYFMYRVYLSFIVLYLQWDQFFMISLVLSEIIVWYLKKKFDEVKIQKGVRT